MNIHFRVVLRTRVERGDAEAMLLLIGAKRRWRFLAARIRNSLVVKSAREYLALSKGVRARPAMREIEVGVLEIRSAGFEIDPVETDLLLGVAFVVGVLRGVVRLGVEVPGSGVRCEDCYEGVGGLHRGCIQRGKKKVTEYRNLRDRKAPRNERRKDTDFSPNNECYERMLANLRTCVDVNLHMNVGYP